MTRYPVQPRDRIFVKGYRFLYFAKNSRNQTTKIARKFLIMLNNQPQMNLKLLLKKKLVI